MVINIENIDKVKELRLREILDSMHGSINKTVT
jgi:hypothetical protein